MKKTKKPIAHFPKEIKNEEIVSEKNLSDELQESPESKKELELKHQLEEDLKKELALIPAPRENFKKEQIKEGSIFDKKISSVAFFYSHLTIFLVALVFLLGLGFYLNLDNPKFNYQNWSPVTRKPASMNLEIKNPDDELLVFENTIRISGVTSPHASIFISNGESDINLEADSAGEFSKIIDLEKGLNLITVNAVNNQGDLKTETRTIYYSEEKL